MTALYERMALQHQPELDEFVKLVRGERITSYLEIGAKYGGSLWQIANAMPKGSRVIAIDIHEGHRAWRESEPALKECIGRLNELGYEARMIWGNSTDPRIVDQVRKLSPFDLVLIDANHTMPFVTKDWENYGDMASIVAFHDISWKRPPGFNSYSRIDVPQFWNVLRTHYRHAEIKLDPTGQDNGIGVLWREDEHADER